MTLADTRYIPVHIKNFLRQEAHFGCAACGSPILEYHHIIPYAEVKTHNREHMIALCPTHHTSLGKMNRKKCYELKKDPYNRKQGIINGILGTEAEIKKVEAGNNTYENIPTILSYYGQKIISYRVEDGQFLTSIHIPGRDFWPDLLIKDNDMIIRNENLLDVNFRTNYVKINRRGGSYIEIDIRKEVAKISADFEIGGQRVIFDSKGTNLPNMHIENIEFFREKGEEGGDLTIFAIGDGRQKIHFPNYAMAFPKVIFSEI